MDVLGHWAPDAAEWDAVTAAIAKDRDLSGIPYPARALAFSALEALADRDRAAVEALKRIRDHGQTHDEPCWAVYDGVCASTMQEIARATLAALGSQAAPEASR